MAQTRITNGDDLILVDMEYGAGLDYAVMPGTHPPQHGYNQMATNWLPAVKQAITNQLINALGKPTIDTFSVSGGIAEMSIGNLATGRQVFVQQTEELSPPVWSNLSGFVPSTTQTNWTVPTAQETGFYRITIQ